MLARVEQQPAKASGKLRPVMPIATRGVDIKKIDSELPTLEWLDPKSLTVETDYQRDLSPQSMKIIRRIVSNWSWSKIKPAVCVRAGSRLVIIDGQHTAIAAVTRGDISKIPVMIVDVRTVRQRAEAFISQNRDRLALTPMHLHYAAIVAGDEIAVAVDEACTKAKVRVLRFGPGSKGHYQVGDTLAIGIISRIVSKIGVHNGARVLKVLVDAKRAPLSAHEIAAVYQLLFDAEYKGKIDAFDVVTAIRSKPMEQWRAKAWSLISTGVPRRQATAKVLFRSIQRAK